MSPFKNISNDDAADQGLLKISDDNYKIYSSWMSSLFKIAIESSKKTVKTGEEFLDKFKAKPSP